MLLELHVRNLALIERADVEFGEGLNILTGETGSGKSIFMGSVNMALGGKVPRDMVRKGGGVRLHRADIFCGPGQGRHSAGDGGQPG